MRHGRRHRDSVPRLFWLWRHEDPTGISGVGIVAEGIMFTSGQCALAWLTGVAAVGIYPSLEHLRWIHGHDGKTEVIWELPNGLTGPSSVPPTGDIP